MSSAENDTRPVWLTREQRDLLRRSNSHYGPGIAAQWDAAPADPAEAVEDALIDAFAWGAERRSHGECVDAARAVLAALGAPTTPGE